MPTNSVCDDSINAVLLRVVVAVAELAFTLADRRQLLLERIGQQLAATAGVWACGQSNRRTGPPFDRHASNGSPTNTISMHFGMNAKENSLLQQFTESDHFRQWFQSQQLPHESSDGVLCTVRRDLFPDTRWVTGNPIRESVYSIGKDSWMHSVRYGDNDTWSSVLLFRNIGDAEFSGSDKGLLVHAMTNIRWLWATELPMQKSSLQRQLTARQRTVLWMLLGGASRKSISKQLGIAEDTVGDHVKAIFNHYEVGSSIELAALFLRSMLDTSATTTPVVVGKHFDRFR